MPMYRCKNCGADLGSKRVFKVKHECKLANLSRTYNTDTSIFNPYVYVVPFSTDSGSTTSNSSSDFSGGGGSFDGGGSSGSY